MPQTRVIFFTATDDACPLLQWLDDHRQVGVKARDKCIVKIERLAQEGYELRRPDTDYLRDDIYELRARLGHVNYRMLYFFHGGAAIVTHGFTKESCPLAKSNWQLRMKLFIGNPGRHTYLE